MSKTQTIEVAKEREQPMPLYHTVIHNCSCHTFDDVIFGLMRVVGTGLRDAEHRRHGEFRGGRVVRDPVAHRSRQRERDAVTDVGPAGGLTPRFSIPNLANEGSSLVYLPNALLDRASTFDGRVAAEAANAERAVRREKPRARDEPAKSTVRGDTHVAKPKRAVPARPKRRSRSANAEEIGTFFGER